MTARPSVRRHRMSDVSETRGILASSAVMASGTIVSRMSGYVRNLLLAAAIGNELHADLFNIGNTIPNMLYILLAGGVFNAVLVPQLVRAQKGDPDGGEAYTNRVITLAAAVPRRGHRPAGDRGAAGDAALPEQLLRLRRPERPARLGDRVRPLLPAAGLLLRHVRAARPGAQRPRPVRPDDVGPDRQQRDRDPRPGALPGVVRPARPRPGPRGVHRDAGARPRRSAPRSASPSRSWSCCPTCARPASTSVPATTSATAGSATPCGWACGPCCSSWSTRSPTRSWSASPPAAPRRAAAATTRHAPPDGTGYTVYAAAFLFVMVPHAIITVSLATAILPRLSAKAADGDLTGLAGTLAGTLRTALADRDPVRVPAAAGRLRRREGALRLRRDVDDVRPLRDRR